MTRRTAGSSASRPTSSSAFIWVSTIPRPWDTARRVEMCLLRWSAISSRSHLPTSRRIPFRAPPGIKMESVNLKTGLPAAPGDPKAIMEAFKPTQDPLGAVAADDAGSQEGLAAEEYGQAGPTPPIPGGVPGEDAGPPPPPSKASQKPPAAIRSKGTITAGRTPPSPAPGPAPAPGMLGRIFGGF